MSKLYFCNTHYNVRPPVDINPLILQRYNRQDDKICVICTKEGSKIRINKLRSQGLIPQVKGIYGIWEIKYEDFLNSDGTLKSYIKNLYNVFVVINQERIYKEYSYLLSKITRSIQCF